ncbi:hypothetical protein JG688_00007987 [Phytophthora aleatoria]|uniref:Uncharacterized protein n=1 Tax=Phytophthora aleatoria TaxID=2496075 RepID=A0A8J5IZ09_9STRA|nr:hypothetical protein JG688_00007987 [Phytophthora aleatoria]
MALNDHGVATSPPERILSLLGLDKSSIAEELRVMVSGRFRPPQQAQLADILSAMQSTPALSNVASWFSHQFDPIDDVEHYLQDLIRMHHYIAAHDRQRPLRSRHLGSPESASDSTVMRQLMQFYASFADSRDRHLLTKIYQTLGLSRAITYCVVAKTLPFKVQKEFLDLFAEDLPELRDWITWLDELEHAAVEVEGDVVYGPGYESTVNFVSRAIKEHCMLTWFGLLRPLDTVKRLALIDAIHKLIAASNSSGSLSTTTSTLKKLGRFYETTGITAAKLLDLDIAVRHELSLLLEEFPTIILITLFTKFNNKKMIHLVVKRGLPFFPKNDLLKMLDALAPAEINAIEVFMSAWPLEALDAFFQLLLMLAKVEYKMFAKLMGSQYVSAEQLDVFITVAVDMMNQASSRELVIFAAELPVHIRDLFFEMLADRPEKGALLRIIGYSTRVPPELMHILVALFHRMSWEIRSSFIEQLRALEGVNDVENLAEVASNLQDNEALRLLVLLINPLQIQIRVSLVALFLQLNVQDRALLLARLVKMPKNSVGTFCTAICSSSCEPVSASFCRVIGLVDPKYHTSLLRLLTSESLWFFLRLMAEHCDVEQSLEQSTELLNQVAKTVCLFSLDIHLLLLRDVIQEALGDAMPLRDIVAVLALFPDVSNLLDFLRYVFGFAKCARTSLIFRVLSKYQQPAFIFEMCRILDLDDSEFALKRLDRMWQRRHEELDKVMESLSRL